MLAAAAVLLATMSAAGRADTVASLLGNFTINQFCGLRVDERAIGVRYTVVFGQLPALRELHAADADGDGVTSEGERNAYAAKLAPELARALVLTVDGAAVALRAVRWTTSLPTEQGGFSLRIDVDYTGEPASWPDGAIHAVAFENRNFAGRFGWQEIVVEHAPALAVFDTNGFGTSLTAGLADAVPALPASGPLAERVVSARVRRGAAPAGSELLKPRPGTAVPTDVASVASGNDIATLVTRATRALADLIAAPSVAPHVVLLALLGAALLGALHAFSPGHGKTVVGAYLIGARATARHAVFLGATVTITHTLGVFALGFATLFASRFVVPERMLPALSLVSGLLVLAIGATLLRQRLRSPAEQPAPPARTRYRTLAAARDFAPLATAGAGPLALAHAHHHPTRGGAIAHSHGGSTHTHLPPEGERVTWKGLLALGVSGGVVPCPSAMVLLLAAVALGKTGYGLLMVLAFSAGLAAALTAVGLAFLHGRERIASRRWSARTLRWLPVGSATAITLVGAAMCCGAIASWPP